MVAMALVFEVPLSSKDHGNPAFVASGNDVLVLFRATRLNDRGDPCFCCLVNRIGEGEEGIGGQHGTLCPRIRFANRDIDGIDAAHLSSPGPD